MHLFESFGIRQLSGTAIKRTIAAGLLCLGAYILMGQNLEISGGYVNKHYFKLRNYSPHYRSDFPAASGFSVALSVDDIKTRIWPVRITVKYINYEGDARLFYGGLGGSTYSAVHYNIHKLSLAFFPLNVTIFNNLKFGLGADFAYIIDSRVHGERTSHMSGVIPPENHYVIDKTIENDRFCLGILARLSYYLGIGKEWFVAPQYTLGYGPAPEINAIGGDEHSFGHFFEIGISRALYHEEKH